jgi:oligoendopeptidase F
MGRLSETTMLLTRRDTLLLSAAVIAAPRMALAADPVPPTVWDLTDLFATPAAWSAEYDAVGAALPSLAAFKGRLGEGPATLKAAVQLSWDLTRRLGRLSTYAEGKADEDLQDAPNQERRQLLMALSAQLSETAAWIEPELLSLGADRIRAALAADAGLAKFRFYLLDVIRRAPHTLDAESEGLLAAASLPLGGAQQIRNQLMLSDIVWPEITLVQGTVRIDSQGFEATRTSPDRAERKRVFDAYFGTVKLFESSLGAALATHVQSDVFNANARHYPNALAAALAGDDIPAAVYETLVTEARAGLPVLHRYLDMRRRLLGLNEVAYHDLYPPLAKLDRKFDIATMRTMTLAAVAPLGPDYVELLGKVTLSPWMHALPQKGKLAGAHMDPAAYDVHPYLLLNLTDDYESMSTFAHEWGHAMHTLLADKAQPYETSQYATFTAEIASTVNEQLLAEHMYRTATTRDDKLFYLARLCELLRTTFYRQAMFAEFELAIHRAAETGEALSGRKLTEMYGAILGAYYGPVAIDPVYALEWAYPEHFYFNFYVWQYATSISAAVYFSDRLLGGGAADRAAYLGVLEAGGSDYPVEILKRAGLDMTTPAPYRALVAKLGRTLDAMDRLLAA